jgi:dolichyl-phosphate-mannose--protein O-mannosyl transferase
MDEVFYVPEAMGILAGEHCSTVAPNCHMEHPYLAPALDAVGMAVFGEFNVVGWRILPVLLGTFTLPLFFVIVWKASQSKRVAYVSTILLSLDVMFFSQSSAALLDIPEVFFGVAAFFAYFVKLRFWKFDRYVIAGILLGAAGLAKETALFFALGFLTYIVFFDETTRKRRVYSAVKVALVIALVFIGGLQAYDSTLASPAVPTFYQHINYILSYGSSLNSGCPWACGWTDPALGGFITPFNWITYYSPVAYYKTEISVCSGSNCLSYVGVGYYGVTNFLETWTIFIWIPLAAYALYHEFRRKQPTLEEFVAEAGGPSTSSLSTEARFAGLALVWFLWTYLPYVALFFAARVTYPFYFVPAVPAVAMGCGYWVTKSWFPRWLLVIFMVMVFVFFFIYFPYKGFLPDWLRAIIAH